MSENDLTVALTFSIPLLDENGNPINLEDIVVYHIIQDEDGQTQLVPLTIISREIDGDFISLTAHTTGFSPFAVVTTLPVVEPPKPPEPPQKTPSRSSSSMYSAVIISNAPPEENKSTDPVGNSSNVTPPVIIPPIPDIDIIRVVHGNLSIFSIFVVLMSGIFMWNYIRRNL